MTLWVRRAALAAQINRERQNPAYLPGIVLPREVRVTSTLSEVSGAELVLLTMPSHTMRATMAALVPHLSGETLLVCAAKGIEIDTLKLMPEVIAEHWRGAAAYLSGPSFAVEVARGLPTSVVVAARDSNVALRVQEALSFAAFRCYTSRDVVGVEVGGALKNVYAIAAGAAEGLGLGHNAQAAMITRGLNEMALLGHALGAQPLTFAGLAGLGDLVLTCTGALSRNRGVGLALAQGKTRAQVDALHGVAEGVRTSQAAYALAERHHLDLPILRQVRRVLYEDVDVQVALAELSQRDLKPEWPDALAPGMNNND